MPAKTNSSSKISRLTQAERSSATRERVCRATLEALAEVGHDSISTTMIAHRANLSRGALTHQFPTRNDLLVAALRQLHDNWRNAPPVNLDPLETRLSMADLTEVLWQNVFGDPHYLAAIELMLAARLDTDLGRGLREEMESWVAHRDDRFFALLRMSPDCEEQRLLLRLTLSVLRGIAVHRSFDQSDTMARQLVSLWQKMLRGSDPGLPRPMPDQDDLTA